MGRGGSGVGKADKKKKDKSGGGGSTTVYVGKVNPLTTCIVFGAVGFVFLLLTIIVPVALVLSPAGDPCDTTLNSDSVNLGEQLYCKPEDLDETWRAETDVTGKDLVKVYKVKVDDIKDKKTTRLVKYHDYNAKLKDDHSADWFPVWTCQGMTMDLKIWCTGKKCKKIKMYWMDHETFSKSFNSDEEFVEPDSYKDKDFLDDDENEDEEHGVDKDVSESTANKLMYLIFSNKKEKGATIHYNADITYTVYDLTGLEPESCGIDCEFDDMNDNEAIILDYPKLDGTPENIPVNIHNEDINWSAVIACALIFGLITLCCFLIAAVYGYKFLKKVGKLGKKVAKKIEKEQEKQAEASAGYSDGYGGQPAYPGQM